MNLVYILSPHADTQATSLHVEDFVRQFPGRSLPVELAQFSFPTQLQETQNLLLQPEKQDLKYRWLCGCYSATSRPRGYKT